MALTIVRKERWSNALGVSRLTLSTPMQYLFEPKAQPGVGAVTPAV